MIRVGVLAISWSTACGASGAARDVQLFQEVLSGKADGRACASIGDASLAGECTLVAALRASEADPTQLEQLCPDVQSGLWRDECWFQAAEARAAKRDKRGAGALCQLAGRFSDDCAQHLWQGDLNALVHSTGGFAGGLDDAEALAKRWAKQLPGIDFDQRYWSHYFTDGFAVRNRVDLTLCDSLPDDRAEACVVAGVEWYGTEVGVRLNRVAAMPALCLDEQPTSASLARWFAVIPDPRLDAVVLERREALCGQAVTSGAAPG